MKEEKLKRIINVTTKNNSIKLDMKVINDYLDKKRIMQIYENEISLKMHSGYLTEIDINYSNIDKNIKLKRFILNKIIDNLSWQLDESLDFSYGNNINVENYDFSKKIYETIRNEAIFIIDKTNFKHSIRDKTFVVLTKDELLILGKDNVKYRFSLGQIDFKVNKDFITINRIELEYKSDSYELFNVFKTIVDEIKILHNDLIVESDFRNHLFRKENINIRIDYMTLLTNMMLVDNKIRAMEINYLYNMSSKLELTDNLFLGIVEKSLDKYYKEKIIEKLIENSKIYFWGESRYWLIKDLIDISCIDGEFHNKELKFIQQIAKELSINDLNIIQYYSKYIMSKILGKKNYNDKETLNAYLDKYNKTIKNIFLN